MAKQTLNNLVSFGEQRTKINSNFDEVYASLDDKLDALDIGVTVQGYNANTVIDAAYVHTDNNFTTAEQTKLAGIAAGAEVNVNADWNAVSGDAQILNKPALGTAAALDAGAALGAATLGADGKLATGQIPDITITDTFVVNSEAAMLALSVQKGDVAVRSDLNNTFILKAEPASTLSNWQMLPTPTDAVLSVNSKTGVVVLNATDVGAAEAVHTHSYAGSSTAGGAANSVANSLAVKFDTGTTEGTDLYTFDGSSAKTVDIKAGTNVSLTKTAGSITINATGAASGDVTGPASSVDSQIALFDSTTGKVLKASTNTGLLKATSGVIANAVAGTDYQTPLTAGTDYQTPLVSGTDYLAPSAIGSTIQAHDADLDAIAALVGTSGLLKKTAANTWSLDTTDYLDTADIGTTVQAYDADLTSWAGISPSTKQDTLVSGTSIKTINSTSLLGSGDVAVQPTLVSGTNIKTINGTTLLGSGDITTGDLTATGTATLSNKTYTAPKYTRDDDGSITGGTWAIDYANGPLIKATVGAAITSITLSNLPASGTVGHLKLMIVNPGAFAITFPAAWKFIKSDFTTTTFSGLGITLPASGVCFFDLITDDNGSNVYVTIARN